MVHIRWATYNARTLGALEAPQAMPVKGRRVRREDSKNSAAQYLRASTHPRIFFPTFFSCSSFRCIFPPALSPLVSLHRRLCSTFLFLRKSLSISLRRYLSRTLSPSEYHLRQRSQFDAQSSRSSIVIDDTRKLNCV